MEFEFILGGGGRGKTRGLACYVHPVNLNTISAISWNGSGNGFEISGTLEQSKGGEWSKGIQT